MTLYFLLVPSKCPPAVTKEDGKDVTAAKGGFRVAAWFIENGNTIKFTKPDYIIHPPRLLYWLNDKQS